MKLIDITQAIGAVTRRVATCERDGREGLRIVAERIYDTGIEDAWDALTNRERIPRWFLPITGELEVGGRYQLEGNAAGEILECEPPRKLAVTWEFGGEVTWVEVSLAEVDGGTRLELIHDAHVKPEWAAKYGPGAAGIGWDLALLGLTEHLRTGEPVDSEAAMAWTRTDAGVAFITGSSDAWCQASLDSGVDCENARERAARTLAFYTGAEAPK